MIPAVIPNAIAGVLIDVFDSGLPSVFVEVAVNEEIDWTIDVVGEFVICGGVDVDGEERIVCPLVVTTLEEELIIIDEEAGEEVDDDDDLIHQYKSFAQLTKNSQRQI